MTKLILGAVVGAALVLGGYAFAGDKGQNIPVRVLTIQGIGSTWDNTSFYKFVDPDNGNVCYVTMDVRGGISCLKNI